MLPRRARPVAVVDGSGMVALIPRRRRCARIFFEEYALSASTRSGRRRGGPPVRVITRSAITASKASES